jgi:hypothetical protein
MLFNECQKVIERLKGNFAKTKNEEIKKQEEFSSIRSNLLLEFEGFARLEKAQEAEGVST